MGITGTGLVTEVVPSRDFGFITQMDEHGLKQEILFFHISNVSVPNTDDTKADETPSQMTINTTIDYVMELESNVREQLLNES